jgi:hypothetical protein
MRDSSLSPDDYLSTWSMYFMLGLLCRCEVRVR